VIASILELPFREAPPLDVLGFAGGRDAVDTDYAGFGWTRVDRLWLANAAGGLYAVDRPLVLALHAADDGPALPDDVLLEFALPGQAVTVLLSAFLARWRPRLPAAPATVLALCNPHRARLAGPPGVHYALGAVDSWLDDHEDGERLRLAADVWCTTGPLATPATTPEAP
jgi:hypothetical protein